MTRSLEEEGARCRQVVGRSAARIGVGDALSDPRPARAVRRAVARALRLAAARGILLVEVIGGPAQAGHVGPDRVGYREAALASVDGLPGDLSRRDGVGRAVDRDAVLIGTAPVGH